MPDPNVVALGRISGPLLSENLLRNGQNLAFHNESETDNLLYLEVTGGFVGIKTDAPSQALTINGTSNFPTIDVDTQAEIGNVIFNTYRIQNAGGEINIVPNQLLDPTILAQKFGVNDLRFSSNLVENIVEDGDIVLQADGIGQVEFYAPVVNVNGDLHATGNITYVGDIIVGDSSGDNVVVNADITGSLIPNFTEQYDLGTSLQRWNDVRVSSLFSNSVVVDSLIANNINLSLFPGNTIYVSEAGLDTNFGTHQHATFKTLKHALSQAVAGDEIIIFPGTYPEEFPLTVPFGVAVKGFGIRSVTIVPTEATKFNDAFLLNGDTTVEFLTVKDFHYNSAADTGYGFRFAQNTTVVSRSPYVHNVTVITKEVASTLTPTQIIAGPAPTGVSLTGDSVTLSKTFYSQELVNSLVGQTAVIDIYPGAPLFYTVVSIETEPLNPSEWRMTVDSTFNPLGQLKPISFYPSSNVNYLITNDIWDTTGNSVGEKWVAWYKSNLPANFNTTVGPSWTINVAGTIYVVDYIIEDPVNTNMWRIYVTTSLVGGVGIPIFSSPEIVPGLSAGRGALADGSVATPASKEASMLFFSVTFIVPNADGITATNGARVEWLNSFTYYANKGIHLTEGTLGFASLGVKFGAEMRSINSANVYGTYGAVAVGPSTLGYLIGHNFGYIGTGTNDLNDRSLVVQANEVVELNNGNIYYDSVDHKGDYRIGDIFYVNQETGQVVFDAQSINFGPEGNITLEGPSSTTVINKDKVETGNIRVHDNNVDSINGPVNIIASTGTTNLSTDVYVTGDIDITADVVVDGNVFLGDEPFNDTVSVIAKVTADLIPEQNTLYDLGSSTLRWKTGFFKLVDVDGVLQLNNNTIQTLTTNTDLTFGASTTGIVHVTTTDVKVNNDLSTGTHSKFYQESVTTTASAGTLDTGIVVINDNSITTKANTDLELRSSGSLISVSLNDVEIENTLTVNLDTTLKNTVVTGNIVHYGSYLLTGNKVQTGSTTVSEDLEVTAETQLYDLNLNNNVITTTLLNSNLVLSGQALGFVNISSTDVDITNNLTVGATFYPSNLTTTTTTTADTFTTGNIVISGNSITTSVNSDLRLLANGAGTIYVPLTNVEIDNALTVVSTTNLNDNVDVTGAITLYGLYKLTGNRTQTGSATVSNNLQVTETAQFADFNITDNVLSTTLTDSDLKLGAQGLGIVNVKTTDVEITQNLTVGGTSLTVNGATSLRDTEIVGTTTLIGNIGQTGNTDIIGTFANNNTSITGALSYFSVPDIKILGNEISVTSTDTDLQFTANGTGSIIVDNRIKFTSNNVTNIWAGASTDLQKSLLLSPNGVGNAVVNSTTSLVLPVGNNTTRTLSANGEVRFNNLTKLFEGYQTAGLVSFKDLYDSDRNTYITSELTPGANDKVIRFGTNGTVSATLDSTKLWSNSIESNQISIAGNTIRSRNNNSPITFAPNGTGNVVLNGIPMGVNNFVNTTNGAFTIDSTDAGYVKFSGTVGMVIPAGDDSERRASPDTGETRWNTSGGYLETWTGTEWALSIGDAGAVSAADLEEITNFWAVVLG